MNEKKDPDPFFPRADLVILFYDEVDTLGARSADVTNHIDARVMTAFLHELDGLAGRPGILVFGATNRIDLVDNALLRAGRFGDLILNIPRLEREAARDHQRPPPRRRRPRDAALAPSPFPPIFPDRPSRRLRETVRSKV